MNQVHGTSTANMTRQAIDAVELEPSRLRAVVLLAGWVRPHPLVASTGRLILDLPIDHRRSVLDWWAQQVADFAQRAALPSLCLRVLVNRDGPLPRLPITSGSQGVSIERDRRSFRGTGGLLRDITAGYDADDWVLVANASQLPLAPLFELTDHLARLGGHVRMLAGADHFPSGLMLIRCDALHSISDVGYIDFKEQRIPMLARAGNVRVLRLRQPCTHPIRSLPSYLGALARLHRYQLRWPASDQQASPSRFNVIEDEAHVDSSALLHDAVVMRGARVESGSMVIRSLVCPGQTVTAGQVLVGQLWGAAPAAAKS